MVDNSRYESGQNATGYSGGKWTKPDTKVDKMPTQRTEFRVKEELVEQGGRALVDLCNHRLEVLLAGVTHTKVCIQPAGTLVVNH